MLLIKAQVIFKENRDLLQSEKALYTKSTFAVPMMTIDELKPSLDEEIARLVT